MNCEKIPLSKNCTKIGLFHVGAAAEYMFTEHCSDKMTKNLHLTDTSKYNVDDGA